MASEVPSSNLISSSSGDWEIVIGLEVHAQVTSRAKLFSGAATKFGAEPNSQVSLVDAAMPGMLPVINEECVAQAVRTGLGLKAKINLHSVFDRKNYFYPDLPQGYQISQFSQPIVGEGEVVLDMAEDGSVAVGIERLHLEQDAGKSLHDQDPKNSYVDLNRSGVALMEIVSRPDIRSSAQAQAYVTKLRSILRYLGTCNGDMEEGSLRADVNVSVRHPGDELGTRCEIKNMNSIRFIGQAIEHEARRQIDILEEGGEIAQETRLFDTKTGETRAMRSKEEAHDYRYFPDPDLLPIEFTQAYVDDLAAHLPELPDEKSRRFEADDGLRKDDVKVLLAEKERADLYEEIRDRLIGQGISRQNAAREACKQVLGPIQSVSNSGFLDITIQSDFDWAATASEGIIINVENSSISQNTANTAFVNTAPSRADPMEYVREHNLLQLTDTGEIEKVVDEVIAANPKQVEQVKAKPQTLGWFVGQVMQKTGGKANPQAVNQLLREKLGIGGD